MPPPIPNFPGSVDTSASLVVPTNNTLSYLVAAAAAGDTSLQIQGTLGFPSSGGFVSIDREVIYYAGINFGLITLTGCLRGQGGTSATSHARGALVEMRIVAGHHETLANAIINVESKLLAIATKTASYPLTASDGAIIADASSAVVTLTLPDATTCIGREYRVYAKSVTNGVSLSTNPNTQLIYSLAAPAGANSYTLPAAGKSVMVKSDGAAWYVFESN